MARRRLTSRGCVRILGGTLILLGLGAILVVVFNQISQNPEAQSVPSTSTPPIIFTREPTWTPSVTVTLGLSADKSGAATQTAKAELALATGTAKAQATQTATHWTVTPSPTPTDTYTPTVTQTPIPTATNTATSTPNWEKTITAQARLLENANALPTGTPYSAPVLTGEALATQKVAMTKTAEPSLTLPATLTDTNTPRPTATSVLQSTDVTPNMATVTECRAFVTANKYLLVQTTPTKDGGCTASGTEDDPVVVFIYPGESVEWEDSDGSGSRFWNREKGIRYYKLFSGEFIWYPAEQEDLATPTGQPA